MPSEATRPSDSGTDTAKLHRTPQPREKLLSIQPAVCTISMDTHRGHWGHRAGTALCTQGQQLHEVAVAPTELLWVAPSAGHTSEPTEPWAARVLCVGGAVLQPAGLAWPPRCCLHVPGEATQKLFCLRSRAKPRHT